MENGKPEIRGVVSNGDKKAHRSGLFCRGYLTNVQLCAHPCGMLQRKRCQMYRYKCTESHSYECIKIAAAIIWVRTTMATGSELIEWSAQWRLDGDSVICRQCSAIQKEINNELPFQHLDNCLYVRGESFPWRQLEQPQDND